MEEPGVKRVVAAAGARRMQLRGERHLSVHLGAALKVLICSITGFHSACSVRI